jgi:glycosyltransferase involved in cell wall biosynthesis
MPEPNANPLPNLRVALLLPGLGRVQRGAETAFHELAKGLTRYPDVRVTLFGTGDEAPDGVQMRRARCVPREVFERWPQVPVLRNEYCYEELSFILSLISRRSFRRRDFDVAVHCTFPFTNWFLRAAARKGGPKSVFVTQNGDWPCRADSREFRTFRCDGLVCTNPEYFFRQRNRYPAALIPNGVDPEVFRPAERGREAGFPTDKKIVLMASALIPSKRVADGVRAVARIPDAFLVVVGDGPERETIATLAAELLPGRYRLLGSVPRTEMAALYRQADVFLHMSQDEPFGIVYLEAAASGLPVVAHDAAVPRWILGDTALYANTSDHAAVGQAVQSALIPDIGDPLAEAARARVLADWTWTAQAAKYRDFLYSLVPSRRPVEVSCSR